MIGNDIVVFSYQENKHQNRRFVRRILSEDEQLCLSRSSQKEQLLWSMWAAKEAAYKAHQRNELSCLFSPVKFTLCHDTLSQLLNHDFKQTFTGCISYKDNKLHFQLEHIEQQVVHCTAAIDALKLKRTKTLCKQTNGGAEYKAQSAAVRQLAQQLLRQQNIHAEIFRPDIIIKKKLTERNKPGPPVLMAPDSTKPLQTIISLSHDHQWLAVALLLSEDC